MLYKDGALVEQYNTDRSYESLSGYIEDNAIAYARGENIPVPLEEEGQATDDLLPGVVRASASGRPNPEGKVIAADDAKLEEIKRAGPAFVEFFAPWCSQLVIVPSLSSTVRCNTELTCSCKALRPSELAYPPFLPRRADP
jgi:hypothetical protein